MSASTLQRGSCRRWLDSCSKRVEPQKRRFVAANEVLRLGAHSEDNIPYDKDAPLETRVRQSLALSLQNLQTDYIDSWVMHGPENNWDDHFEVWRTMEEAVDEGKVRQLGMSNFYRLEDVEWAYNHARIKPKVVQNRFYSDSGHDVEIRTFCEENDIEYQSFWTLTANRDAYSHPEALEFAKKKDCLQKGCSTPSVWH
ncbi:aldo-keto reductase family protein [Skeletonema marinoi]|uniref:Aldo-keto reductase family protein n=1 Tax=Skeletonema marinoi TaxID=267567 RepID=A0AAD8YNL8_9STRA|nr:aldo-keto reductase family protein [Skeletonema marinoi]